MQPEAQIAAAFQRIDAALAKVVAAAEQNFRAMTSIRRLPNTPPTPKLTAQEVMAVKDCPEAHRAWAASGEMATL